MLRKKALLRTHAAFIWETKLQKQGNVFDLGEIHPHVAIKPSLSWMEGIFCKCHLGHKTKADGKKYYVKPVKELPVDKPVPSRGAGAAHIRCAENPDPAKSIKKGIAGLR